MEEIRKECFCNNCGNEIDIGYRVDVDFEEVEEEDEDDEISYDVEDTDEDLEEDW